MHFICQFDATSRIRRRISRIQRCISRIRRGIRRIVAQNATPMVEQRILLSVGVISNNRRCFQHCSIAIAQRNTIRVAFLHFETVQLVDGSHRIVERFIFDEQRAFSRKFHVSDLAALFKRSNKVTIHSIRRFKRQISQEQLFFRLNRVVIVNHKQSAVVAKGR